MTSNIYFVIYPNTADLSEEKSNPNYMSLNDVTLFDFRENTGNYL